MSRLLEGHIKPSDEPSQLNTRYSRYRPPSGEPVKDDATTNRPRSLSQRHRPFTAPQGKRGAMTRPGDNETSVLNASPHWTARHQNGGNPAALARPASGRRARSYDRQPKAAWIIPYGFPDSGNLSPGREANRRRRTKSEPPGRSFPKQPGPSL